MPLKNNVVVITGASTGIGEELAYQLADQGAQLVLTARRVIVVSADVAIESDCKKNY
jgi:short-subunit dehydrogenase